MSLPREWNLQDSRGSLYCSSESNAIGGIEYKQGGIIYNRSPIPPINDEIIGSEPVVTNLLSGSNERNGSLYSIHSAPPVPIADLGIVKSDNLLLGFECAEGGICSQKSGIESFITGSADIAIEGNRENGKTTSISFSDNNINTKFNSFAKSITEAETGSMISSVASSPPRRPKSLAIETALNPTRALHASFLQHQISEIEEDDNENLLTVSSITARPLIAKSRELRSNRLLAETQKRKQNNQSKEGRSLPSSAASAASTEPPDGGYGWFIVFGAFSVQFWVAGLVKSYGVLYVEIMETFPKTSASVASWIPAILSALCLALAPLSSALCQKYSCRTVVFIGGLFCAFGLTLSYFATSLLHLLFTFGILTGIGGGLSTTPGIVMVSQYFDKHRALANGICVSGTAAGSFILPVLIEHLVHNFGFHGTILILGGCMLHVCVSATLYKPLEIKEDDYEEEPKCITSMTKSLTDLNLNSNGMMTNSTYLDTSENQPDKKFIEHLFLEEAKNRINDYYNTNKFVNISDKNNYLDSDDEGKDVIGETTFTKPMKSVRSSSILHSAEDLSTDSTWVYRKHSGLDSNRSSKRRQKSVFSTDEIISKIQQTNLQKEPIIKSPNSPLRKIPNVSSDYNQKNQISNTNKGLSKSMEIPTPASYFDDTDDNDDDSQTCCDRIHTYIDLSLLNDSTFILMCLSVTLMSVGCPYMLYYLPAHVISCGYSKSQAGYLVAVSGILDLIGRLGLGYLSDLQIFDRKKIYLICILGAGTAVLTIPSANSLYLIGFSAAAYGFCLGCWYLLMPVLLADLFGTDRISSSYGLVRMFQSIGAISVPPLAGFLRDLTGDYEICFYCMGTSMVCGSLPLLAWAIIQKRKGLILFSIREDSENNSTVS